METERGSRGEFGRWGWILVGAIVLSFILIPLVILVSPPTGFSFRFAFIILPLFPAIGLALIAVYSALQS